MEFVLECEEKSCRHNCKGDCIKDRGKAVGFFKVGKKDQGCSYYEKGDK